MPDAATTAEPITATPPAAPATAALPSVRCMLCEYDLRGLPRDGRCPECGAAVAASVARDEAARLHGFVPLDLAPRPWLRKMLIGCVCMLAVALLAVVEALLTISDIRERGWPNAVVSLLEIVFLIGGLWMLSTREPAASRSRVSSRAARYAVRIAAVSYVGLPMIMLAMLSSRTRDWLRFWGHVNIAMSLIEGIATAVVLLRLADALRRAGSRRRRLRGLAVTLAFVVPLATIAQVLLHSEINYARATAWVLTPHPVLGFPEVIAVVPWTASFYPDFNPAELAAWAFQALLSLMVIAVIAAAALAFRRAAARSRSCELAATSRDDVTPAAPDGKTAASSRP